MNRDKKIDTLKGVLILLVVFAHIPFDRFKIYENNALINIKAFIYFFHMPLFFAISVLFIKKSKSWILKRILLLLIPYIFWFLISNWHILLYQPIIFFKQLVLANWNSTKSIIWFLPALFSLNFLVYLSISKSGYINLTLHIFSILSFALSPYIIEFHKYIPFGIDVALYLFILTSIIKYLYKRSIQVLNISLLYYIGLIIVSSFILFIFEPLKTHSNFHSRVDFAQFSVPITFVGYFSFIILNVSIFCLFIKIKQSSLLSFVGAYSFPIFLLHLIIFYKLPVLVSEYNELSNLLYVLMVFILSIILPILISRLFMNFSSKFQYIGFVK